MNHLSNITKSALQLVKKGEISSEIKSKSSNKSCQEVFSKQKLPRFELVREELSVDVLALTDPYLKMLSVMFRQHRDKVKIAYHSLAAETGYSQTHAKRLVKWLLQKGVIFVIKRKNYKHSNYLNFKNCYKLNPLVVANKEFRYRTGAMKTVLKTVALSISLLVPFLTETVENVTLGMRDKKEETLKAFITYKKRVRGMTGLFTEAIEKLPFKTTTWQKCQLSAYHDEAIDIATELISASDKEIGNPMEYVRSICEIFHRKSNLTPNTTLTEMLAKKLRVSPLNQEPKSAPLPERGKQLPVNNQSQSLPLKKPWQKKSEDNKVIAPRPEWQNPHKYIQAETVAEMDRNLAQTNPLVLSWLGESRIRESFIKHAIDYEADNNL